MVEHGQISYETPHFVELVGADDTWVRPYGWSREHPPRPIPHPRRAGEGGFRTRAYRREWLSASNIAYRRADTWVRPYGWSRAHPSPARQGRAGFKPAPTGGNGCPPATSRGSSKSRDATWSGYFQSEPPTPAARAHFGGGRGAVRPARPAPPRSGAAARQPPRPSAARRAHRAGCPRS